MLSVCGMHVVRDGFTGMHGLHRNLHIQVYSEALGSKHPTHNSNSSYECVSINRPYPCVLLLVPVTRFE